LSKDEEAEFLKPFFEPAAKGMICVAGQIKKSLEDLLDHKVHHSTVYRMLHRNGWREVVPRPVHPQAKEEAQEAFKKTSRSSQPRLLKKETQRIQDPS
jgi:transposase